MAKSQKTKEGKVAIKIVESVNDFDLDLDNVGMYIAQLSSSTLYNRLDVVMESAREHKEYDYSIDYHEEYLRRLSDGN
jgi:hypothetical protein